MELLQKSSVSDNNNMYKYNIWFISYERTES